MSLIEESQVVVHEAHDPDSIRHLVDADVLASEGEAPVDLSRAEAVALADQALLRIETQFAGEARLTSHEAPRRVAARMRA